MKTTNHKNTDPKLVETSRLMCYFTLHLDANQSRNCPSVDHTLLLEHHKTPHYILQSGSLSLEGISLLRPPLPGRVIKAPLFYFTLKSVSEFLFGTGKERPRLDSTNRPWTVTGPHPGRWGPLC